MKIQAFPPALIFYVDALGPNTGGEARGPVVRILKKYLQDEGILKHELEHVKQYWTGVMIGLGVLALLVLVGVLPQYYALAYGISIAAALPSLAYGHIKPYRLWAELKAYAVQVRYKDDKEAAIVKFGTWIFSGYNLGISSEEAIALLRKETLR